MPQTSSDACHFVNSSPSRQPNWEIIRKDFPILEQDLENSRLSYLDSAASSQIPLQSIDRMAQHQTEDHSNIHRGLHTLSIRSTEAVESTRKKLAKFIHAPSPKNVIFVRGATEGINFIASSLCQDASFSPKKGDNIVLTVMEHHANIVPWVLLKERLGFEIRVVDITPQGDPLSPEQFLEKIDHKTRFVGFVHISNTLGTINRVEEIVSAIRSLPFEIPILVDGCQAPLHEIIDVQKLDVDFYVLSAHKMVGPTGVGLLYMKDFWLDRLQPYQGGGDMILSVTFDHVTFNQPPSKFEAGTPPILPIIGWGESLDYLFPLRPFLKQRENELGAFFLERLKENPKIKLIGLKTLENRAALFSLDFQSVHPHDVGTILAAQGVAVRAGHHCTQPLMQRLGLSATTRVSLAFYNNVDDIERFFEATKYVWEIFG